MTSFNIGASLFAKLRRIRNRILTLGTFNLFLQWVLLILVLLDTNATLLLKRDAAMGHVSGNAHDWVSIGAGVVEFILGPLLGWWGGGRKNLALAFWLAAAGASGLLVLAFPYQQTPNNSVELCGGESVSGYSQVSALSDSDPWVARVAMLCITSGLCALARLSLWAHGLTLLDEYEPGDGAYAYGILVTIRLSLGLNGVTFLTPYASRDTWWYYHLALCMLTLLYALLFSLFPRGMGRDKLNLITDDDMHSKGFLATMGRVVSDKTIIVQTLALAFLHTALFSFIRFDKDFVKAQFHIETERQDPRASRSVTDIFRSLVIICYMLVFRTRFSGRRADGVKATTSARVGGVVAIVLAVLFVVIAVLSCGVQDLAYGEGHYVQPACSMDCGCVSESYGFSPVCALNTTTTYFSPCHAGCQSYEDLNGFLLFDGCECSGGRAARGACSLPGCRFVFNVYQLMFASVLAVSGSGLMMQGMSVLRSALVSDRATALGACFAVVALLSHVPGHLLYMLISNLTCAYRHNGGCLLHRPSLWSMAALSSGLSVVSGVLSLYGSRLARGPT